MIGIVSTASPDVDGTKNDNRILEEHHVNKDNLKIAQ